MYLHCRRGETIVLQSYIFRLCLRALRDTSRLLHMLVWFTHTGQVTVIVTRTREHTCIYWSTLHNSNNNNNNNPMKT